MIDKISLEKRFAKITWEDGFTSKLTPQDLQRNCPCMRCTTPGIESQDCELIKVESVGNYALKFHFTLGCQKGIFPFDLLRRVHIQCSS